MIIELRIKEGITQEELAKKLQTIKSAISRLENHVENVRLVTLENVAKIFGKEVRINCLNNLYCFHNNYLLK